MLLAPSGALSSGGDRADDSTTLYVGGLHPCASINSLHEIFSYFGPLQQAKIIKDKHNGQSAGYGFVKFLDRACAEAALLYLNGKLLYGQELRVNWAFQSHQREDTSTHYHVFVGDLGQEVTDAVLFSSFAALPGTSDARVMWDHVTGRSKGYGFVSLRTRDDAQRAIATMHGQVIGSRRVRCGWAQHKAEDEPPLDVVSIEKSDPMNTNVYVGNIPPEWSEPDIRAHFSAFGAILEVKLHKKGGYGFIRYEAHDSAVRAIVGSHGLEKYGRYIKAKWGKSSGTAAPGAAYAPGAASGAVAAAVAAATAAAAAPVQPLMLGGMSPMGAAGMVGAQAAGLPNAAAAAAMAAAPVMVPARSLQPGAATPLAGASLMPHSFGQAPMLSSPMHHLSPGQALLLPQGQTLAQAVLPNGGLLPAAAMQAAAGQPGLQGMHAQAMGDPAAAAIYYSPASVFYVH